MCGEKNIDSVVNVLYRKRKNTETDRIKRLRNFLQVTKNQNDFY